MIENRSQLERSTLHRDALECLADGIAAADPERVLERSVSLEDDRLLIEDDRYDLGEYDRVIALGGGKAAGRVAVALESTLGDRLDDGIVVTDDPHETETVRMRRGDHPLPSERGVEATRELFETAAAVDDRTLVIGIITGGGSSLLTHPAERISLDELVRTTELLLESGATIESLNAVRKHLSAIKGGQLARTVVPAEVVCLVFSDVIGNDLATIASGPFAPDGTTFGDAKAVLDRYDLSVPTAVRERIEAGIEGDVPETPGRDDRAFRSVSTHVLADANLAVEAATDRARDCGLRPIVLSTRIRGEAREAAKSAVAIAEEALASGRPIEPPAAIVSGGETTVTVDGDGHGGPNQEFALSAAVELTNLPEDEFEPGRIVVAAVDTDGIDGPTDAAGAIVDGTDVDPDEGELALDRNDAYAILDDRDCLIRTGPTGTNVNDLRVTIVGNRS